MPSSVEGWIPGGAFAASEEVIFAGVQWLRLGLETLGAVVVAVGAARGIGVFVAARRAPAEGRFVPVRLTLARSLSLALEFQLAADILSTAIAPSWDQIGKLGAIAVIRTGLNYFLAREVRSEMSTAGDAAPATGPTREQAPGPHPS